MHVSLYGRGSAEFDRGVSFFDAIYGFAITLLITTVHVPGPKAWTSVSALLSSQFGTELFGFVLSFVVISLFWRLNYRLIGTMSGMSSRIVLANIVCVFFVILIPFTTQAMNANGLSEVPLATALYALNIALASLSQAVMYEIAEHSQLVQRVSTRSARVVRHVADLLLPVVFLASIPIAYLAGPHAAQYSWAILIVLVPLFSRIEKRLNGNVPPSVVPPVAVAE